MEKMEILGKQPRRKFFTTLFSGIAGLTVLFLPSRRAQAEVKDAEASKAGAILYHRTEETERYYRTLYR